MIEVQNPEAPGKITPHPQQPSPPETENTGPKMESPGMEAANKKNSLEIERKSSSESEKERGHEEAREEEEYKLISKYKKMRGGRRKQRTEAQYAEPVQILKQNVETAIKADNQLIMKGQFGGRKLHLIPKLMEKLSNKVGQMWPKAFTNPIPSKNLKLFVIHFQTKIANQYR